MDMLKEINDYFEQIDECENMTDFKYQFFNIYNTKAQAKLLFTFISHLERKYR